MHKNRGQAISSRWPDGLAMAIYQISNRGQAISSRYPLDALTLALKVVVEHPLPLRFFFIPFQACYPHIS